MGDLLRDAAARGESEIVVRLLGEGVKNLPDEGGRNALHLAAASGHADVVAALLLARWDVNAQDAVGCTALQRAAAEGHVDVLKQLIKHGANVNIQDKLHGNTALHEASWRGYSKCVEALCQVTKANLQIKNAGGFAPLHLACQNGHNQSCRELLMANCNPDIQNNYGDTPLHTSARYGHAGVTRILISADCHMSDQNKNGDTALHITAAMGRRKLTRILLQAGCDPNRRNKQNERARDIAMRKDLNEIIDIIDKTQPMSKKDRQREKERKEKLNEKKRGKNESGSSKDSSSRPKEKKKHKNDHQVHFEKIHETKWSPYGCHYYPDPKTFPKPKLDSLPHEPLKKGEQYYLDLAGNIRKGPVGVGYTCYCAPFFRHMEERLDRDKKELKDHIDAAHVRLDKKVTSLEAKTRGQLNEITRSMAVERAKCHQRHLHLEQWLIRGTIFRNSEKVKASASALPPMSKSRSLENILEEKPPCPSNAPLGTELLKDLSSSREDKGSSEAVGPGISDGEDHNRTAEEKRNRKQERRLRRSTREISERIDEVLRNGDGPESMEMLYDEMMKWRSYHNALGERDKENQRSHRENRPEEPERKSVQEMVAKLQKQQTVQELVAKIQRKTGLIHKSAQKWKENKARKAEVRKENAETSESSEAEELAETAMKSPPNYENIRQWDSPQDALSQLPYRCRNTVYSPSIDEFTSEGYQRNGYGPELRRPMYDSHDGLDSLHYARKYGPGQDFDRRIFASDHNLLRAGSSPTGEIGNQLYTRAHLMHPLEHHTYSPTQNDSGYSTKPYGGSSTGPSPSLSGQDFEVASAELKPPVPIRTKSIGAATASLV